MIAHAVGALQQALAKPVSNALSRHARPAPGPGDQVVHGDDQRARRPAGQPEVDGVIESGLKALEIRTQSHSLLVARELAVVAAARAGEGVSPGRQGRLVETSVEQQGKPGIKTLGDQTLEQAPRVRTNTPAGAWALQGPNVQQHPWPVGAGAAG